MNRHTAERRIFARRSVLIGKSFTDGLDREERAELRYINAQVDIVQLADAILRGEFAQSIENTRKFAKLARDVLALDRKLHDVVDGGTTKELAARAKKIGKVTP